MIPAVVILFLSGCAASSDQLWAEYIACHNENMVPKVDDRGVVYLEEGSNEPVMVFKDGACLEEQEAWYAAEEARERYLKRREDTLRCPGNGVMICRNFGVRKCDANAIQRQMCDCQCVERGHAMGVFR